MHRRSFASVIAISSLRSRFFKRSWILSNALHWSCLLNAQPSMILTFSIITSTLRPRKLLPASRPCHHSLPNSIVSLKINELSRKSSRARLVCVSVSAAWRIETQAAPQPFWWTGVRFERVQGLSMRVLRASGSSNRLKPGRTGKLRFGRRALARLVPIIALHSPETRESTSIKPAFPLYQRTNVF